MMAKTITSVKVGQEVACSVQKHNHRKADSGR